MKDRKRITKDRHPVYLQCGVTWCNRIDGGGVSFSLFFEWCLRYEHVIVGGIVTLAIIDRTVVVINTVTLRFWEANNLWCWVYTVWLLTLVMLCWCFQGICSILRANDHDRFVNGFWSFYQDVAASDAVTLGSYILSTGAIIYSAGHDESITWFGRGCHLTLLVGYAVTTDSYSLCSCRTHCARANPAVLLSSIRLTVRNHVLLKQTVLNHVLVERCHYYGHTV